MTQVPTLTPCTVPCVAQLCFSILTKQGVKHNTMCCSSVCKISAFLCRIPLHSMWLTDFLGFSLIGCQLLTQQRNSSTLCHYSNLLLLFPRFAATLHHVVIVCWSGRQVLCRTVASMAVEPSVQQDVRRAALHCLTGLCGRLYLSVNTANRCSNVVSVGNANSAVNNIGRWTCLALSYLQLLRTTRTLRMLQRYKIHH